METLPIWKRVQIEIGGRWQMLPDKNTSWRQWLISPGCRLVWPGKEVDPRKDWPEGAPRKDQVDIVTDDERDPTTNLRRSRWYARYFWATCYLRVLGLDLGAAVLWLAPLRASPAGPSVPQEAPNPLPNGGGEP